MPVVTHLIHPQVGPLFLAKLPELYFCLQVSECKPFRRSNRFKNRCINLPLLYILCQSTGARTNIHKVRGGRVMICHDIPTIVEKLDSRDICQLPDKLECML